MCRECPAATEQREVVVAVTRAAEPEWCQLHPHVWHRRRRRLARRCFPGHSGARRSPALRSRVLGSPLAPPCPRNPPRPPLHPGGAPESAAVVQPPSEGSAARPGGPRKGWRAGAGDPGAAWKPAGSRVAGPGQRAVPRPARSRRADKIKACQGVGAGGGAHTPPGREIPIVCQPYI